MNQVVFSPDGDQIASSGGGAVTVWGTGTGRELYTLHGEGQLGSGMDFSPDGSAIITSLLDGTVRLWDAASTAPVVLHTGDWVNQVAFSRDSARLVAADTAKVVRLWDVETGKSLSVMASHKDVVRSAAWNPDGTWILSASWDGSAEIWYPETGRHLKAFISPRASDGGQRPVEFDAQAGSAINQAALSPDGTTLATACWDGVVHLREIPSGVEFLRYMGHRTIVWFLAYSPDGQRIASSAGEGRLRVWNAHTGRDLWSVPVNLADRTTTQRQLLAFSPDGRLLAGCTGYEGHGPFAVQLWDAITGSFVRGLDHRGSQVNAVAFSPDGTRIATAGEDRTVNLWATDTGQNIFVLRGHTAPVLTVAFSPDGQKIASGGIDATVRIWDAPSRSDSRAITPTRASDSTKR